MGYRFTHRVNHIIDFTTGQYNPLKVKRELVVLKNNLC